MRTCVGCRTVEQQATLVRVAFVDGVLAVAAHGGRGAYLHPSRGCAERAGRGGLARALRRAVGGDDLARVVSSLSRPDDIRVAAGDRTNENGPGQGPEEAVEISPRSTSPKAEDQRSEDASL